MQESPQKHANQWTSVVKNHFTWKKGSEPHAQAKGPPEGNTQPASWEVEPGNEANQG